MKTQRRWLDRYPTPTPAIEILLQQYPNLRGDLLLDPCSGQGHMAEMLKCQNRFTQVHCNDVDLDTPASTHLDAQDTALYLPMPCWVVTNPPFCHAADIARVALTHTKIGVALLLRCTFLEPCKNRRWLSEYPPTSILSLPRMSFTNNGKTDSAPAWWFLWIHGQRGTIQVVHHLRKHKRQSGRNYQREI